MFSRLGFGSGEPIIDITLPSHERYVRIKEFDPETGEKVTKQLPLFLGDDPLAGEIEIRLNNMKKIDHMGVKIELIGQINVASEKVISSNFLSLSSDLEPSGSIYDDKNYKFAFDFFQKPYESYYGTNCTLRYLLRVTVIRRQFSSNFTKELDIAVFTYKEPEINNVPINMDVGIEGILAVSLNFPRTMYHLKDIIAGEIQFSLVKLKIKSMSLAIIKKEILGSGVNSKTEKEEICSFEIMDGCPAKEETIPIRFHLQSSDMLGPSFKNVNNKFSVVYLLNLLIIDQENQKYFKNNEIQLFRKRKGKKKKE